MPKKKVEDPEIQELADVPEIEQVHIVGLKAADSMPIQFKGTRYDLALLTKEQENYLRQFPEAFPYLK